MPYDSLRNSVAQCLNQPNSMYCDSLRYQYLFVGNDIFKSSLNVKVEGCRVLLLMYSMHAVYDNLLVNVHAWSSLIHLI